MRAFVVHGPGHGSVEDVAPPEPGPGQAVVEVIRVGVCGTDVEFFTGDMAYLDQGHARYPIRLGHEWCGEVVTVGSESIGGGSVHASPATRWWAVERVCAVAAVAITSVRSASRSAYVAGGREHWPSRWWSPPRRCMRCPRRSMRRRERWSSQAVTPSVPSSEVESRPASGCSSSDPGRSACCACCLPDPRRRGSSLGHRRQRAVVRPHPRC